jgi:hypothetical protein
MCLVKRSPSGMGAVRGSSLNAPNSRGGWFSDSARWPVPACCGFSPNFWRVRAAVRHRVISDPSRRRPGEPSRRGAHLSRPICNVDGQRSDSDDYPDVCRLHCVPESRLHSGCLRDSLPHPGGVGKFLRRCATPSGGGAGSEPIGSAGATSGPNPRGGAVSGTTCRAGGVCPPNSRGARASGPTCGAGAAGQPTLSRGAAHPAFGSRGLSQPTSLGRIPSANAPQERSATAGLRGRTGVVRRRSRGACPERHSGLQRGHSDPLGRADRGRSYSVTRRDSLSRRR